MLRQNNRFVLLHSIFYYKHILNNKNENLIIDVNFYQQYVKYQYKLIKEDNKILNDYSIVVHHYNIDVDIIYRKMILIQKFCFLTKINNESNYYNFNYNFFIFKSNIYILKFMKSACNYYYSYLNLYS